MLIKRNKTGYWIFCFLLLTFFVTLPTISLAANLYFYPSSGTFKVGQAFSVSVYVSSSQEAMNAASGTIHFPQDKVLVSSLSKTGSIFDLWVKEPSFSNSSGTITFEGVVLNPGFQGSNGKIITINFLSKNAGRADLSFLSGSVLANDGKGTNILKSMGTASFNLEYNQKPSSSPNAPPAPKVSSPTHPDPNKWYSNNNPKFVWEITKDITGVGLLVGRKKNAAPAVFYSIPISEKQLYNLSDGVWYFHAQLKNQYGWGGITTFRFQIDTTPPEPFKITIDNGGDPTSPTPTLHFETKDKISGIKYYKIKIEGRKAITTSDTSYQTPPLPPGEYTVVVEAFDQAENSTAASTTLSIKPLDPPVIKEYPKKMSSNETLIVKGTSKYPNSTVTIFLQKDNEEIIQRDVKTDDNGNWNLVYDKNLGKGVYQLWAQVTDKRGAKSNPTSKVSVIVTIPSFILIGKLAINYLAGIVTIIALILLLVLMIFYVRYRIKIMREEIKKRTKRVEKYISEDFERLVNEVEKQVSKLDGKPDLSKREREIYEALKKILEESKKKIEKKIENIDRKLG